MGVRVSAMNLSTFKRPAAAVLAALSLAFLIYDTWHHGSEYVDILHHQIYGTMGPLLLATATLMIAMNIVWRRQ